MSINWTRVRAVRTRDVRVSQQLGTLVSLPVFASVAAWQIRA